MFGILVSALNTALAFIFRSLLVKFVVFFALWFVTTEFVSVLSPMLPNSAALSASLGGIPAGVWYFLDLFNISAGIPALLSAFVTRFIIRRLPVIG